MSALQSYLRGLGSEERGRLRCAAELFERGVVEEVQEVEFAIVNLAPPVKIGWMIDDTLAPSTNVIIGVRPAERLVRTEHGWVRVLPWPGQPDPGPGDLQWLEAHALPLRDALLGRA